MKLFFKHKCEIQTFLAKQKFDGIHHFEKKNHLKLVKLIVCNLHIDKANLKRKINIKRSCLSRNKMIPEENMEIWEEMNTRKNKHV